jgi:protocatechuate 3,4-dioxygenase beta subunit
MLCAASARRDEILDSSGLPGYRFDIVLRGENETSFFVD